MSVPLGIELFSALCYTKTEIAGKTGRNRGRAIGYRVFILILTFLCYASYHLSRKPISVVKNSLHKNCTGISPPPHTVIADNSSWCSWQPFDKSNYDELFGVLDVAYLAAYAVGMFCSGYIAERMNLRHFMTIGMVGSGFFTAAFGFGYFFNIHAFAYYVAVQVVGGLFQATGWPSVVTCMGNWYGKGRRGLIMGLWNSHTSVGNILGSIIPGFFADHEWGWSFVVPGIIIAAFGIIVFFFLVPHPKDVGCESPDQHGKKTFVSSGREQLGESTYATDSLSTNSESSIVDKESTPLLHSSVSEDKPISVLQAIMLPGVLEFSLCLFFAKLVSYTFLFWLPNYIGATTSYSAEKSADLSTLFDVGGILGGIVAGIISDWTGAHGCVCVAMLLIGTPALFMYDYLGNESFTVNVVLLMICGGLVNGPYSLITTAVSADLGTQEALRGNSKALATVTAIIDGTGSVGAALGPLFTGVISPTGWSNVFYMLIAADIAAALLLTRVVVMEIQNCCCTQAFDMTLATQVLPDAERNGVVCNTQMSQQDKE